MSTSRFAIQFVHQTRRSLFTTPAFQSGHNKWSKIKQKKGVHDTQRSAIFGKARRDIVVAVRSGGSDDPAKNVALAAVLRRAKSQGVPKENIESALLKGMGNKDKGGDQHLVYEALAYNSVGIIIECLTDNTNRTIHNVRGVLTAHGARFAPVMFMFQREGQVRVALKKNNSDNLEQVIEHALSAGATDFDDSSDGNDATHIKFSCSVADLSPVTNAVTSAEADCEILTSELIYTPKADAAPIDDETRSKVLDLTRELEEDDDTLRVWTSLAE